MSGACRVRTNAAWIAGQLKDHKKLTSLKYPFLPTHPQFEIAKNQMQNGGGIFCFELKDMRNPVTKTGFFIYFVSRLWINNSVTVYPELVEVHCYTSNNSVQLIRTL